MKIKEKLEGGIRPVLNQFPYHTSKDKIRFCKIEKLFSLFCKAEEEQDQLP